MEFFDYIPARKKLISVTWSRLRLLDPTLRPWGLGENIATTNPQVLQKDHFMQHNCFNAFWTPDYTRSSKGKPKVLTFVAWCRTHKRYEAHKPIPQLMFQLACDFLTYEDWINIAAHNLMPASRYQTRGKEATAVGMGPEELTYPKITPYVLTRFACSGNLRGTTQHAQCATACSASTTTPTPPPTPRVRRFSQRNPRRHNHHNQPRRHLQRRQVCLSSWSNRSLYYWQESPDFQGHQRHLLRAFRCDQIREKVYQGWQS